MIITITFNSRTLRLYATLMRYTIFPPQIQRQPIKYYSALLIIMHITIIAFISDVIGTIHTIFVNTIIFAVSIIPTNFDDYWLMKFGQPCGCAALFQRALDLALFGKNSQHVSRITMVSKLNVDYITKRLLVLINTVNKSEQDINDIIVHINEKAPQLLEDLSIDSKRRIVKGMQIKYYEDNEVIFRQGDVPDAYYTIVRGSVSIYAQKSSTELQNENISEQRKQYGNLLVKLGPSASFGELSFNADGNHSTRNAGVISDGYHGLVQEEEESDGVTGSNVAVLLLIPEKLYLSELFSKHVAKHQTNEKISLIEGSILFKHWPMDQKVKLAYAMKRKQYSKGSIVAKQGDRRDFLFFINRGILNVVQKMGHTIEDEYFDEEEASNAVRRQKVGMQMVVEIADLYVGDIFGLVEIVTNSKKLKREAIAKTMLDVFVVQVELFSEFLQQEKKTAHLIEKVSYNRLSWESLRRDYAMKFSPIMPLSLPKSASELSNYCISPLSILSENEHQHKKRNDTDLARKIRAIRSLLRPQSMNKNKSKKGNINTILDKAKKMCDEALDLADDEKKLEVNKLIEMIHKLKEQ